MEIIGNKISFKTYNSVKVNESIISLPEFEKKDFYLKSSKEIVKDFDQDTYGISEEIVKINKKYNNLYRSYRKNEDSIILDIELNDDYNQLFDTHDIVAESGDEITLVLNYTSKDHIEKFRSTMVRIYAKASSKVNFYIISLDDKKLKSWSLYILKLKKTPR